MNCDFFFGRLTINILDTIMASHLSLMLIFVDRPNGELCVLSIVNFSIFGQFFYICSDSSHCIFSMFCLTPHGQLQRYIFSGRLMMDNLRIFRWPWVNALAKV